MYYQQACYISLFVNLFEIINSDYSEINTNIYVQQLRNT